MLENPHILPSFYYRHFLFFPITVYTDIKELTAVRRGCRGQYHIYGWSLLRSVKCVAVCVSQWTDVCRSGGRSVTQRWRLAGARQYSTVSHITTHCSVSQQLPACIVAYTVRRKKCDILFSGYPCVRMSDCPSVCACVIAQPTNSLWAFWQIAWGISPNW